MVELITSVICSIYISMCSYQKKKKQLETLISCSKSVAEQVCASTPHLMQNWEKYC